MDEFIIIELVVLAASHLCFYAYRVELGRYESKKDFWKVKTRGALTGLRGMLDLIGWNITLIIALPAGIIWRTATWMKKSSRN